MYAMTLPTYGGPEVMTWAQVPDPLPGPGEVTIDVAATAVNRADVLQRQGHYPAPPGASPYLGLECSGVIAELGDDVIGWSVGDPVCALLTGGGYAERVAVRVEQLLPVPTGVGLVEAAALPEVTCTAWSNVFMTAGLRPGELLLVHGGTSGVGTMAIQIAVRHDATVAVTAGSAHKLRRCSELGATILVNYREDDFVARVRQVNASRPEEEGGSGADVILDNMGAKYLSRNVEALATGGRLVVIGLQGGRRAELDLGVMLAKRASVTATSLRLRAVGGRDGKAAVVDAVTHHVWPDIAAGRVRPVIDRVVPITDAAAAHMAMEAGEHVGKIVLTVSGS